MSASHAQYPPQLVTALSFFRASIYSSVSASALFLWDWLLTFDDEFVLIWKSKTSLVKSLFLFNRYFNLVCRHVDTILYFIPNPSLSLCLFWVKYFQVITGTLELLVGEIILVIRLWALYGRNRGLLLMLMIFWAACGAASIAVLVKQSHLAQGSNHPAPGIGICILTSKLNFLWAYWIPFVAFEVVVFSLSCHRTLQHYSSSREYQSSGFRPLDLITVMFRDSTFYFFIMLAIVVCNTLVFRFGTPGLYDVAHGPTSVMISIMLSRMTLNVRKAARVTTGGEHELSEVSTFRVRSNALDG